MDTLIITQGFAIFAVQLYGSHPYSLNVFIDVQNHSFLILRIRASE